MDKLMVDVAIDKLPEMKVLKTKQILQMFIISIKITSKNFELDTSFLMYFSYRIYSLNTFFFVIVGFFISSTCKLNNTIIN